MALAVAVESLDGIPEALRGEYEEVDGRFVLKLEGVDSHPTVIGLKNNHDLLRKQVAEARAKLRKLDGLDPETYRQALSQVEELQEQLDGFKGQNGGKITDEEVERRIERALEKVKKEHAREVEAALSKLSAAEKERDALTAWRKEQTVVRAIEAAADAAGARPEAKSFIVDRGLKVFKVSEEGGKIVAEDEEGMVRTDKGGVKPLTPLEWIKTDLFQEAPFLFPSSSGGGAGGGAGGKKYGGIVSREDFKSEGEEANFIREHGKEVYLSLPGKSKFIKL